LALSLKFQIKKARIRVDAGGDIVAIEATKVHKLVAINKVVQI
jgi:hypothetical protein